LSTRPQTELLLDVISLSEEMEDTSLTPPHPIYLETNAAMAAAIEISVVGGSRANVQQAALGALSESEESLIVRNCLESAAGKPVQELQEQMGWVLIALQSAFYQLLQERSLEAAIIDTVLRDGDTDTLPPHNSTSGSSDTLKDATSE